MNEKDRRIVTFGGDDDIASEYENISMDFDIPEETPASSGTYNAPETDSHNDASSAVFFPVDPSAHPAHHPLKITGNREKILSSRISRSAMLPEAR